MRISYWSSDVCSSDLLRGLLRQWPKGLPGEALRIGATELLFLDAPGHAAVHSAVDIMAPGQTAMRGLVNAVLRKLSTEGAALVAAQDAAKLNTPDWLWRSWTADRKSTRLNSSH